MTFKASHLAPAIVAIVILANCAGQAVDARSPADGQKLDLRFLNEQPYRKKKRATDVSSIQTSADLAVVKDAINPVMKFLYGISQVRLREQNLRAMTTEDGYERLHLPPQLDELNRYGAARIWNWKVADARTVEFTAEFRGLLESQGHYVSTFVFIHDGEWKFDRHAL